MRPDKHADARDLRVISWGRPKDGGSRCDVTMIRKDDPFLSSVRHVVRARDALEACATAAWFLACSVSKDPVTAYADVVDDHALFPVHAAMSYEDLCAAARTLAGKLPEAARIVEEIDAPYFDCVPGGAAMSILPAAPDAELRIVRFQSADPRLAGENRSILAASRPGTRTLVDWLAGVAKAFADRFVPEDGVDREAAVSGIVETLRPSSVETVGGRSVLLVRISYR